MNNYDANGEHRSMDKDKHHRAVLLGIAYNTMISAVIYKLYHYMTSCVITHS